MSPRRSWLYLHLACVLAWLALTAAPRPAHAGDPSLEWKQIETEHFVIYYYEPHGDIARRVAVSAEHSHTTLAPALGHEPEEKTLIVITDDTDGANGFANAAPRNAIHLFATAPAGFSVLNDHDDWLYGLVGHEYTHVLHLDTISGIPRWYNKIFGKWWSPNQIQPRWFIEGLATYEESKRSSSGRVRSAVFDMYLRMHVLAGRPLRLDQISTGPLTWPQGNTAYLYGSHFLAWLADRYGDDVLRKISQEYGRQPLPFGLNRAVKRATGKDYLALYEEWKEHLEQRYTLQRQAVDRRGRREGRRMTFTGQSNSGPRYTIDGRRIIWIQSNGREPGQYRVVPTGKDASASEQLDVIDAGGAFSMLPDGSGFVVERGGTYRTNYAWGDLWRYDFATRGLTRLTHGARAADPTVSPDGTQVAFTVNGASRLRLAVMPLRPDATIRVVWEGANRWDQVFSPSWSPDGKTIAFSAWRDGGYRDIMLYDVASGTVRELMHDRAIDGDPEWTPDGRWLVFSSDRTGIYNLYAVDPAAPAELWQITNVYGGAFTPDVAPDGTRVVYMGYDADGFEIFEMALDRDQWLVAEPYVNDRPEPVAVPDPDGDAVWISEPRPYRPLETLAPNRWKAELSTDSFGSALTVSTDGSDIVGFHGYTLGATVGLERGDISFAGAYGYNRLWPTLRIAFGRSIGRPSGLVVDNMNLRYHEEAWALSTAIGLPVLRNQRASADLSFSYELDWRRNLTERPEPLPDTPVTRMPETGWTAGLAMRFSLSTVKRTVYSVGSVDGRQVIVGLRYNHPDLGSDTESVEVTWRWQEFWQLPRWPEHTISLRYGGGIEDTTRRRDGAYALGGIGDQNIADAIINGTRASSVTLRGYEPGSQRGRQFHLLNFEYRFPLLMIERGWQTLPFYFRRVHGALLFDAGWAGDTFDWGQVRPAVGGVLRLDAVFGFYEGGTFELGYSRGLADDGVNQWWLLLAGGI